MAAPPFTPSSPERDSAFAKRIFWALALALLPLMIGLSFDYGVTWDEKSRHRYGENIWELYAGVRSRDRFGETGGHLYGGLFDFLCVVVEHIVPGDRYVIRHALNAIFGWIGVVYCGRLAANLFGRWTGVLAMVLLAASPRYLADSMNNPKDIPLAALSVMSLYYISLVSPRWPYLSWKTAGKITLALALTLNVRVAALMYLAYLGFLVGVLILLERNFDWRRLCQTALKLGAVAVTMLLLGTLVWPWAQGNPFWRPFRALLGVANYGYAGGITFAGAQYSVNNLPWWYAPWWMLISTPPVVLVGVALGAGYVSRSTEGLRRAGLFFVALLPIVVGIVMHSTLYDGVRHLLFTYPAFVTVAASGWGALLTTRRQAWARAAVGGALALGLTSIIWFDVRFHPNQIVYFNSLVSGPRGAFARYDMDYWGNCVLQAVKWTAEQAREMGVPVVVSGNPSQVISLDAMRFHELQYDEPYHGRHHYHIRLARGPIDGVKQMAAEPALHQVLTPDGVVLCNVLPGPAFGQLETLRAYSSVKGRGASAK